VKEHHGGWGPKKIPPGSALTLAREPLQQLLSVDIVHSVPQVDGDAF
jgi:hypothetical protein